MKRIVIYVLWLDDKNLSASDENKFRYNLRQFVKCVRTFESEDFDVDIHIITNQDCQSALLKLQKILQIAKKQKFLKNLKTLSADYGKTIIDLSKYCENSTHFEDACVYKSDAFVEKDIHPSDNADDVKNAKIEASDVKNDIKMTVLYNYFVVGHGYRVDRVDKSLSIESTIKRIRTTTYEHLKKIISGEVCMSDFAGLNLGLKEGEVKNIILPEQKQYSILVSKTCKELPSSFSLEGYKLLHLLYALSMQTK